MFYTVVFEPPTDSVDYKRCRLIAVDHAEQVNLLWNASVHDLDYTVSILLPLFMPHIPYTLDFKREFLSTLTFELRQQLLLIMPLKIICSSFEPTPAHVRFLEFLLSCGFNPNNKSEGLVLLEIVLFYLAMAKNEQEVGGWISHLRSIVTLLLRKGADPHIPVEAFGVDQTMTSLAVELGLLEEWARALSESGYDPMEVYVESERRLKEEKMFQGAKPSAVDMAELLPPSKIMERRSGHVFEEE